MVEQSSTPELSAEAASRLVEFARACKAAARAVSLYPGGHPAIATSLSRLVQISARITAHGAYRLQVLSHTLLADGAGMSRPDAGVAELAELLHRHLVGRLTVSAGADTESWRTLLVLLARAPEDVRSDGGIAHLWATAGGSSIELEEIDYAEVLRQKEGAAVAVDQILAAALGRAPLDLDDSGVRLLLNIVQDRSRLDDLMKGIEAGAASHGATAVAAAFLTLARSVVDWISRHEPDRLDATLRSLGHAAGRMSADAMLQLLDRRYDPEAQAGTLNVAGAIVERMSDQSVSHFVAKSVIEERGASERLAQAFSALVPDVDRQRRLLALAERDVAAAESHEDAFTELWQRVENMLTSYSDESFVSEQYARELSGARTRATDVAQTSDDPPERIAVWLSTVADASLRNLDLELLTDLLAIEVDPLRWRDVADTVAGHAEDLVRVGHFDQAWHLAEAIGKEGDRDPSRKPHALAALERLGRGSMMKHVSTHLRAADEASYARVRSVSHAIGPAVIPPLAEVLATEQDARSRRRLRDILLGFGARGSESVRQLMNAPNWEVRRTAAYLLREFGGAEALKELVPLLTDDEPLVRREAVQALVMNGSDEASKILLEALRSSDSRMQTTLVTQLTGLRDERAAPVFCYLVHHLDRRRHRALHLSMLEALGTFGGPDAVEALKFALYQGEWRSPFGTRMLRRAAAGALRRLGTADALDVLRDASTHGTRGVRAAARAQLAGAS